MDNNNGATLDDLIEFARSIGCELRIEFKPKCNHPEVVHIIRPPGMIHTVCNTCHKVINSEFYTKTNGRHPKTPDYLG